ncbi:MAG: hypothetical protein KJ709_04095 [Nanoarchaeota archaeon]|nr:hypothetical protein [Nanoarchaeota archaeon]
MNGRFRSTGGFLGYKKALHPLPKDKGIALSLYKRIIGHDLFLFRIRFSDDRKEKRIIYLVDKPYVKVLCILDRDKEYKDLSNYLRKLGY